MCKGSEFLKEIAPLQFHLITVVSGWKANALFFFSGRNLKMTSPTGQTWGVLVMSTTVGTTSTTMMKILPSAHGTHTTSGTGQASTTTITNAIYPRAAAARRAGWSWALPVRLTLLFLLVMSNRKSKGTARLSSKQHDFFKLSLLSSTLYIKSVIEIKLFW